MRVAILIGIILILLVLVYKFTRKTHEAFTGLNNQYINNTFVVYPVAVKINGTYIKNNVAPIQQITQENFLKVGYPGFNTGIISMANINEVRAYFEAGGVITRESISPATFVYDSKTYSTTASGTGVYFIKQSSVTYTQLSTTTYNRFTGSNKLFGTQPPIIIDLMQVGPERVINPSLTQINNPNEVYTIISDKPVQHSIAIEICFALNGSLASKGTMNDAQILGMGNCKSGWYEDPSYVNGTNGAFGYTTQLAETGCGDGMTLQSGTQLKSNGLNFIQCYGLKPKEGSQFTLTLNTITYNLTIADFREKRSNTPIAPSTTPSARTERRYYACTDATDMIPTGRITSMNIYGARPSLIDAPKAVAATEVQEVYFVNSQGVDLKPHSNTITGALKVGTQGPRLATASEVLEYFNASGRVGIYAAVSDSDYLYMTQGNVLQVLRYNSATTTPVGLALFGLKPANNATLTVPLTINNVQKQYPIRIYNFKDTTDTTITSNQYYRYAPKAQNNDLYMSTARYGYVAPPGGTTTTGTTGGTTSTGTTGGTTSTGTTGGTTTTGTTGGTTSTGTTGGTTSTGTTGGTTTTGTTGGTTSTGTTGGAPTITTLPGSASIAAIPGSASIAAIPGSASIAAIPGSASIAAIPGSASLASLPGSASFVPLPGSAPASASLQTALADSTAWQQVFAGGLLDGANASATLQDRIRNGEVDETALGTSLGPAWDKILNALGGADKKCASLPPGRKGARITEMTQQQQANNLPQVAPPLNMAFLLSTVASLMTSNMTGDYSTVETVFIKKYGALKALPADDNDSVLLIYTAYPNFYNNFYLILDENNKRIFRNSNFDIQARLINSINQFNRDTMIALHYTLDQNFIVEDVADSAAQEPGLSAEDAYNALKPGLMDDIRKAISEMAGDFMNKCKAAAGPGAGAGAAAPGVPKAPVPVPPGSDAGAGPTPAYTPPAPSQAYGSLPTVISRQEDTATRPKPPPAPTPASASIPMLGPGGTEKKELGPGGTQRCPQASSCGACRGGGCARCCGRDNTDYSTTWQYMVLPSHGAGKCAPEKKKAPSLIWGE